MIDLIFDIETTGLNPRTDRIIAIGVKAYNSGKKEETTYTEIYDKDEKEMVKGFWEFASMMFVDRIVGFNIDFDWTFIKLKTLKYRIFSPYLQSLNEVRGRKIDLRLLLDGYNRYQKGTKLADYLHFFEIPNGDNTNSSEVPKLYAEGKIEEILEHLRKDVESTFQIYKICKECGLI